MPQAAVPELKVHFYQTPAGSEPVRDWLKTLRAHERLAIGEDIKAVQFRWPLGMPLVKKPKPRQPRKLIWRKAAVTFNERNHHADWKQF